VHGSRFNNLIHVYIKNAFNTYNYILNTVCVNCKTCSYPVFFVSVVTLAIIGIKFRGLILVNNVSCYICLSSCTEFGKLYVSNTATPSAKKKWPPWKKLEAQWAEPVSLTFHSALRKLNTKPSIGASYQISVHLVTQFQRRRLFRNRPIRNKNYLWWPCVLTDWD
jgi:hypothetical protein